MSIVINKQQPPVKVSDGGGFIGEVVADMFVTARFPSRTTCARVTYASKARTEWHTHPKGQTLIILEGAGNVQELNGDIQEFKTGETVWIPANVKHWHGGTDTSGVTFLAVQEADSNDGSTVQVLYNT